MLPAAVNSSRCMKENKAFDSEKKNAGIDSIYGYYEHTN